MLVLFESAAGYAIFKLLDEKKLHEVDNIFKHFATPERANKIVKLKQFEKFQDMTEALKAATASVEGKLDKGLRKILKKIIIKDAYEELAVADAKLGGIIKDKIKMTCVHSTAITELMRGIRSQFSSLVPGLPEKELSAMTLGLAHGLSRYKLKFSPDKVDIMIIQAINLLDELDTELNNYVMRLREWYGWHFPELGKIITDSLSYCEAVLFMGDRTKAASLDFSDILSEDLEQQVKQAADISMGTEISAEDIKNIHYLCEEVIEMFDYRSQLYDYLKNRMHAIAPNLTALVGELVGARLISHAGSLMSLAKHPASTVQILGAEKALFRALKTKKDTPKYGLIYHANLVTQSTPKNKGKISRMLAAKTSLAVRMDALGEKTDGELGIQCRAKVEARLRQLEQGTMHRISGRGKAKAHSGQYQHKSGFNTYDPAQDSTLPSVSRKRVIEEEEEEEESPVKVKRIKVDPMDAEDPQKPKKKKAIAVEKEPLSEEPAPSSEKKKKKRHSKGEAEATPTEPEPEQPSTEKKKKKREAKGEAEATPTEPEQPSTEKKKKKKRKEKE